METWSWGRTVFDSTQHCIGTQFNLGVAIATRRLEILLPERESWIRWHFTDMIVHLHDSIFICWRCSYLDMQKFTKWFFTTLRMHWLVISFLHSGLTISQYPTLHTHTVCAVIEAAGLDRKMTTSYSSFHLQHYVIDLEIYKAEKPTTFAQ